MSDTDRETQTTTTHLVASCHRCAWATAAHNGLGNAARHHDATGHPVTVHIARRIIYGNPHAPPPGQTTIPADDLTAAGSTSLNP